jgi:hypothetical protein
MAIKGPKKVERAPKSRDFQGPPLPMALTMYFPASKSLSKASNKQQVN